MGWHGMGAAAEEPLFSPPLAPLLLISVQELGAFLAAGLLSTCSHPLKASQQKCP